MKDGWKYPPATETDCIIQYVNAAFRYDKLLSVLFVQKMLPRIFHYSCSTDRRGWSVGERCRTSCCDRPSTVFISRFYNTNSIGCHHHKVYKIIFTLHVGWEDMKLQCHQTVDLLTSSRTSRVARSSTSSASVCVFMWPPLLVWIRSCLQLTQTHNQVSHWASRVTSCNVLHTTT